MSSKTKKAKIEVETGNVFAQLNLPNHAERLRKARLMNVINDAIERRGLSQKDGAALTGLDQSDISRIEHGRGSRYSTDRLLNILARLGIDVEITQYNGKIGKVLTEVRELVSHA